MKSPSIETNWASLLALRCASRFLVGAIAACGVAPCLVAAEERSGSNPVPSSHPLPAGFEDRKRAFFELDFPDARLDTAALKLSLPYALIALEKAGGDNPVAAEFIAGALDPALALPAPKNPSWVEVDLFVIVDVVRALIAFPESFSSEQIERIERFARHNPGYAGGGTENHKLMRWTSGYYFAQRFGGEWKIDDRTVTADELMAVLKEQLLEEFRFRMDNGGMSEFLSPNYLTHHVYPIMNLVETCEDEELRDAAWSVVMLHLSHLALNVHDGYILEPHARSGSTQFTGRDLRRANGSQYLSWILWGTFDPGPARLTHHGEQNAIAGPFLCDWRLDPHLQVLATGGDFTPFSSRSVGMNWPHSGSQRKPRTTLRSVYRAPRFAIGAGYQKHLPSGFYLQHSIFGITWTSDNEAAFLQCGHHYWFADDGPRAMWKAPCSPFQQMAHHENSALVVFNVPERDPWPDAGRADWIPHRDGHRHRLIEYAMVRLPRELKSRAWKRAPDGGDTLFLDDSGIYLAIRSLTPARQLQIDDFFDGVQTVPRKQAGRSQSAFYFHVGTDEDYSSFAAFQEQVLTAEVSAQWGDGKDPVPQISVTDPDGDTLTLAFNNNLEPDPDHVVPNLPEVVINGRPLDFSSWPDLEGPGIHLENGILTVNETIYQIPPASEMTQTDSPP
jgi:hypothetical protein